MSFRSTVHALYRSSFDDFSSVIGRFQVHSRRDEFPQWRRVTWSMEADLLACSDSLGNVTVLDALCSPICFIPNEVSMTSLSNILLRLCVVCVSVFKMYLQDAKVDSEEAQDLSRSICSLFFSRNKIALL